MTRDVMSLGSREKFNFQRQLTFGFISTCISIFVGLRRGNVADLRVISACDVLVVSGSVKSATESGNICQISATG